MMNVFWMYKSSDIYYINLKQKVYINDYLPVVIFWPDVRKSVVGIPKSTVVTCADKQMKYYSDHLKSTCTKVQKANSRFRT